MPKAGKRGQSPVRKREDETWRHLMEQGEALRSAPNTEATRAERARIHEEVDRKFKPLFSAKWKGPGEIPDHIFNDYSPEDRLLELEMTYQEARVAYGVAMGFADKEIAVELGMGVQQVKKYVQTIYRKRMGLKAGDGNRVMLTLWYFEPLFK